MIDLKTGHEQSLKADDRDGTIFDDDLSWSPDGQTLLAHLLYPVNLPGRTYPIYSYTEHGAYRFYNVNLRELASLNVPELSNADEDDLTSSQFVSSDDVVFTALSGMNVNLYHYNRRSGQVRQLSGQPGSYGNVVVNPNSHQILFRYSSFVTPPELYKIGLDEDKPTRLTSLNSDVADLNQVRTDSCFVCLQEWGL